MGKERNKKIDIESLKTVSTILMAWGLSVATVATTVGHRMVASVLCIVALVTFYQIHLEIKKGDEE